MYKPVISVSCGSRFVYGRRGILYWYRDEIGPHAGRLNWCRPLSNVARHNAGPGIVGLGPGGRPLRFHHLHRLWHRRRHVTMVDVRLQVPL